VSVTTYPTISPYVLYEDVAIALEFLTTAFGFTERLRYTEPDGRVSHAEVVMGDGLVMVGQPASGYRNPKSLGGATMHVHVYVTDVDAHFATARAAGAEVGGEPQDEPYGDRRYRARDPEGHEWFFAQQIKQVEPEEWGATAP
jgi:uncharacterized glyoxalase superfamily protein PhnB